MIVLLLDQASWDADAAVVASPGEDGFVHCCDEHQVAGVRRRYFPSDSPVVAVTVDPTRLSCETRYEPGTGGEPERYPHVYGDIERSAVVSVTTLP